MRETWEIVDSRTGKSVTVFSYTSEAQALRQIAGWVARDAKGGRPDCHERTPFLVPKLINAGS